MPRRPRVVLPHIPLHLIQRGNNRQVCFVADEDYLFYLDWLKEFAGKAGCRIHAYVLMTNHVHLLVSRTIGDRPRLFGKVPYPPVHRGSALQPHPVTSGVGFLRLRRRPVSADFL